MQSQAIGAALTSTAAYDAGVFTWDITADLLFADTAVARLFGLAPKMTLIGLPLRSYVERVHEDDRSAFEKSIADAIVSDEPYFHEYRVETSDGVFLEVTSLGRCFKTSEGIPKHYAGIIFEAFARTEGAELLQACSLTHRLAVDSGRSDIADDLLAVLEKIMIGPSAEPDALH
jgi:PAS domain-containing protein